MTADCGFYSLIHQISTEPDTILNPDLQQYRSLPSLSLHSMWVNNHQISIYMSGGKQFSREKLNSANGSVNVGGWRKFGESVFNKITLKSLKDAVKEQPCIYEARKLSGNWDYSTKALRSSFLGVLWNNEKASMAQSK